MSTLERTSRLLSELLKAPPWDEAPESDSVQGRRLMEAAVLLRRRRRRRQPWVSGALCLAFVAGASGWGLARLVGSPVPAAPWGATIIAPEGPEATRVQLSKGGELLVQSDSQVDVAQSEQSVDVVLKQGGLRVSTPTGDQRVWTVTASGYAVGAGGGSRLSVRMEPQRITVDSVSGQVRIQGPLINSSMLLGAGQRLIADRGSGEVALKTIAKWQPVARAVAAQSSEAVTPTRDSTAAIPSSSSVPATPQAALRVSWSGLIAEGKYSEVVVEAEKLGIGDCLARCTLEQVSALALAARYSGRHSLADRAWRTERQRFAGTAAAADAAFFLGRQASGAGRHTEAVRWFNTYVGESPGGRYGADALGGKMLAYERSGQQAQARTVATDYLRRFPKGVHRDAARRILVSR